MSSSKSLKIPSKLGGKKVRMIDDAAFYKGGIFMLDEERIPAERKTRGRGNFGFETVILPPGLERIGDRAFYKCFDIVEINIPDSVCNIGVEAFNGCQSLKTIVLPSGLETISRGLFMRSGVESGVITESVVEIDEEAFEGCRELKSITIPDTVVDIGKEAFCGCLSLKKVDIPSGLETIPRGLFRNSGLVSVEVPEGVAQIKQEAFWGCKDLRTIRIPNSVVEIGDEAFKDCERLERPSLPANLKTGRNTFEGSFKYAVGDDGVLFETEARDEGSVVIKKIKIPSSLTVLEIPEKITGKVVIGIADGAIGCRNEEYEGVLFPRSITSVGKCLLREFNNARVIRLPGVENIENETFVRFKRLEAIEIPSASKIGRRAFCSCPNLTNVILSTSLAEIPYAAFEGCESLGKIDLPGGVKAIGDHAFQGCSKLQIELFPESLKSIGCGAFEGCAKISRVRFAEGLETLGQEAFKGCSSLTEVYIPDSVKELPFALFCDCENLRAVRQPQDIVHGCDVFKGCEKVPEECKVDAKERKRRAEESERQKRTTFKDAGDVKTEVMEGVDSIVLSACSTAVGEKSDGGEIEGMAYQLLRKSPSGSVLASFWKVDDEATEKLMGVYYNHISSAMREKGSLDRGGALHEAQLALLHNPDTASPYYWAAFSLFGDFR